MEGKSNRKDVFPPFLLYRCRNRRSPIQSRLANAVPYLALFIALSLVVVFLLLAAVLYAVLNLNSCQGEQNPKTQIST